MATRTSFGGNETLTSIDLFEITMTVDGCRGSFPMFNPEIGGHTTSLSLQFGKTLVAVDSGSGIINLGNRLMRSYLRPGVDMADVEMFLADHMRLKVPLDALGPEMLRHGILKDSDDIDIHLIQTHTHIDHLHGLPGFKPIFSPKTKIHFYGGTHNKMTLEQIHRELVFNWTIFPVPFDKLASNREYHTFADVDHFEIPSEMPDYPIKVSVRPMNHPGGAYMLLFQWGPKRVVISLDHEHGIVEFDESIVEFWEDAYVATEAQYDDHMYTYSRGFGHITARAVAAHAQRARVRRIVTTHHDPSSNFERVEAIAREIEKRSGVPTYFARDGSRFVF